MLKRNRTVSQVLRFFPIFLLAFSLQKSWASEVYVTTAEGGDFTETDLESVTTLIKSSVTESRGNHLIEKKPATQTDAQTEIVLKPKLMRIGSEFVLILSKEQNGETFSAKLKFERLENLDRVTGRLTQAVLKNEAPEPTSKEAAQENRENQVQKQVASNRTYFGFGGASLSNLNSGAIGYSFAVGETFDLNQVAIRILGELDIQGTALFSSAGVGLNYYFNTSNYAPYVSGDFGWGVAKIDGGSWAAGTTVFGFVFGFGAGVELFRNASINMDIGFRTAFVMNQNGNGIPTAYTLRLGLYF